MGLEPGYQKRSQKDPCENQQKEERRRGRQGQVLLPRSAPSGRHLRRPQDRERLMTCARVLIIINC